MNKVPTKCGVDEKKISDLMTEIGPNFKKSKVNIKNRIFNGFIFLIKAINLLFL
jgi:hypothetical protein